MVDSKIYRARCRKCGNDRFILDWSATIEKPKITDYTVICDGCDDVWGTLSRKTENGG